MAFRALCRPPGRAITKTLLIMKFTAFLLLSACLTAGAKGFGQQTVTLSEKNARMEKVLKEIRKQTGYVFFYDAGLLESTRPVTIDLKNAAMEMAIKEILRDQSLEYSIENKTVTIIKKAALPVSPEAWLDVVPPVINVHGIVKDENGQPMAGVTISVLGTALVTVSGDNGEYYLDNIDKDAVLVFSSVGYQAMQIPLNGRASLDIKMRVQVNNLDETVVIGYGTDKKATLTGSIAHVKSAELESQPVANPLNALQGRVPGLFVKGASGAPGANVTMQIRGNNSISATSNPLYIIDGVPVQGTAISKVTNTATGNISPFNSINPDDIASIDVLKDADATAIYGSRGANGVVLISTKRGHIGKTKLDLNVYTGANTAARELKGLLNTHDYLAIRRAAFKADNIVPNATNAPDLTVWDTTQNTDWQKMLIGNIGRLTNAQASLSGGDAITRFLLSASYRDEKSIMLGNNSDKRSDFHLNLERNSLDKKLSAITNITYSLDNITELGTDPFRLIATAPNHPLYDSTGKLPYFVTGSNDYISPIPATFTKATSKTDNFIASLKIKYAVLKNLDISLNLGYTKMNMVQNSSFPTQYVNPTVTNSYSNYGFFGTTYVQNYNIQPQADYRLKIGKGQLQATAGENLQSSIAGSSLIYAANFSSNALLESLGAAGLILTKTSTYTDYKYSSFFGRLNYNWQDKYIATANFSRDESTRFGPGNRIGNFWSVGGAWLFSKEKYITDNFPVISFGKLRSSYGLTGNDQIGDYKYLSLYTNTTAPYQGVSGLYASQLANAQFRWEETRKFEAAMELGFVKNRVLLTVNWYRNRSSNLLVNQQLSRQAGFATYLTNRPATVENRGWEFSVTTSNIDHRDFKWTSDFNLTLPVNRLVAYPDLANSSKASSLEIGKPLSIMRLYHYTGIDPATGVPQFEDIDKNGVISGSGDYADAGNFDPKAYGGLGNSFSYKGFQLQAFFQFSVQDGFNELFLLPEPAGRPSNTIKSYVTDYWQKPGDIASRPGLTTLSTSPTAIGYYNLTLSNAFMCDASYIRLKTLSLSYTLPSRLMGNSGFRNTRIYLNAQNLLTVTSYVGIDPETYYSTPPLKTISVGIQTSL